MSAQLLCRSHRKEQAGEGLVELALVLPVFVFVVVGLLDMGAFVYTNAALSQAAREGARQAATEAGWIGVPGPGCVATPSAIGAGNPGAHVCPPNVASFKQDVEDAVNRMSVSLARITDVSLSCNAGTVSDPTPTGDWTESVGGNGCHDGGGDAISSAGDLVSVRIEYVYQPLTPLIGSLLGPINLSGAATMVIN